MKHTICRNPSLSLGGIQNERFGAGDSYLILNVLPPELADAAVRDEIHWNEMLHKQGPVPRLIAIQGTIEQLDGDSYEPLYRHPADEQPPLTPWTPIVEKMRAATSARIGQVLNHALIQWYRNSLDYISPHTDKTLDVCLGTNIVNLSLGASREMVLRQKLVRDVHPSGTERPVQRIMLPHNSLFVMGWQTNRLWSHEIRQDRRLISEKTPPELICDGARISLTFRTVASFRRLRDNVIFGQGASTHKQFGLSDALMRSISDPSVVVANAADADAAQSAASPVSSDYVASSSSSSSSPDSSSSSSSSSSRSSSSSSPPSTASPAPAGVASSCSASASPPPISVEPAQLQISHDPHSTSSSSPPPSLAPPTEAAVASPPSSASPAPGVEASSAPNPASSNTENNNAPLSAEAEEALAMLKSFSAENRDPAFDWQTHYGRGFDVLCFKVLNR